MFEEKKEVYSCPWCNAKYQSLRKLLNHIRAIHRTDECPYCKKICRSLITHSLKKKDSKHIYLVFILSKRKRNAIYKKYKNIIDKMLYGPEDTAKGTD